MIEQLGRGVLDATDQARELFAGQGVGGGRQPEIRKVDAVAFEQDVGRLEIAVDEPDAVRGFERGGDTADDPQRLRGVKRSSLGDQPADVGAVDPAHRREERPSLSSTS